MMSFILCLFLNLCFDSFCSVVNLAGGGLTSVIFLLSICAVGVSEPLTHFSIIT